LFPREAPPIFFRKLRAEAIELKGRDKKEYFWRRVKKNSEVVGKSSFRIGARIVYLLL